MLPYGSCKDFSSMLGLLRPGLLGKRFRKMDSHHCYKSVFGRVGRLEDRSFAADGLKQLTTLDGLRRNPSVFDGGNSAPGPRFPFSGTTVPLVNGREVGASKLFCAISPLLSTDRLSNIQRAVQQRLFNLTAVLENFSNEGNTNGVLRTAEGVGLGCVHIIKQHTKKRKSKSRATMTDCGARRWLFRTSWNSSLVCYNHLRAIGFQQLVALTPEGDLLLEDVDWSIPTAVILGNERTGLSPEARQAATHLVRLSTHGFVGSLNVAAAAAISLHEAARQQRTAHAGKPELSLAAQEALTAHFAARALPQRQLQAVLKRMASLHT